MLYNSLKRPIILIPSETAFPADGYAESARLLAILAVVAGSNARVDQSVIEGALEGVDYGQLEDWSEYGR